MSSASGFSSAIAGNCSSSGARVASRASKERGGADSIRIALVFNDFPCQFPDHEAPDEGTFSALRRAAIDRGRLMCLSATHVRSPEAGGLAIRAYSQAIVAHKPGGRSAD
jgi:hypothetical protein